MPVLRSPLVFFCLAIALAAGCRVPGSGKIPTLNSRLAKTFSQLQVPCNWVVAIDPGHGGTKYIGRSSPNNAFGKDLLEKDLTLEVGTLTVDFLKEIGYQTFATRTTDVNLGLRERTKFARDRQADVFISVHFNGFSDETIQGTETIRHSNASERSISLAKSIQHEILGVTGLRDRGVRTTQEVDLNIVVIRPEEHLPKTAAALVEISFLSDPYEEDRLKLWGYKQSLGKALTRAIDTHLMQQQAALDCVPALEP